MFGARKSIAVTCVAVFALTLFTLAFAGQASAQAMGEYGLSVGHGAAAAGGGGPSMSPNLSIGSSALSAQNATHGPPHTEVIPLDERGSRNEYTDDRNTDDNGSSEEWREVR
jgi:hypothetical protein